LPASAGAVIASDPPVMVIVAVVGAVVSAEAGRVMPSMTTPAASATSMLRLLMVIPSRKLAWTRAALRRSVCSIDAPERALKLEIPSFR
jgi:hypothetical protein